MPKKLKISEILKYFIKIRNLSGHFDQFTSLKYNNIIEQKLEMIFPTIYIKQKIEQTKIKKNKGKKIKLKKKTNRKLLLWLRKTEKYTY